MTYKKIKLGSKVYFRGFYGRPAGLYTVVDRYIAHEGDYDEPDTKYELKTVGEPDSDFIVDRHSILDYSELKSIHDCIVEAVK